MSSSAVLVRRIVAIPIAGAALALLAFGIVRGTRSTGPARGWRMTIELPGSTDALTRDLARRVLADRLDVLDPRSRVQTAGHSHLVAEIPEVDERMIPELARALERQATVELRAEDGSVIADDAHVRGAEIDPSGVWIQVERASVASIGQLVVVVLDGEPRHRYAADRATDRAVHLAVGRSSDDAALRASMDVVRAIEAGAAPRMRVRDPHRFSRAIGFWPRAWPFLVSASVLLGIAAVLATWGRPSSSR